MWASEPITVAGPALSDYTQTSHGSVTLSTQPAFYAWSATLAADAQSAQIVLQPSPESALTHPVAIYYDGIVLTPGERPLDQAPVFAGPAADRGTWGGAVFVNYARNPSAEAAWFSVRPWAEALARRVAENHISPTILVGGLLDWSSTSGLYTTTASRLFNTFWGSFAWGHVALPRIWYNSLAWITGLGVLAAGLRLARSWRWLGRVCQIALLWLGLALAAIWGIVLVRGLFTIFDPVPYIPTARYAYPAIIPTLLLLVAGWSYWPRHTRSQDPKHPDRLPPPKAEVGSIGPGPQALRAFRLLMFWLGFLALDFASVTTIVVFYSGR
jgi:hypothetical protein